MSISQQRFQEAWNRLFGLSGQGLPGKDGYAVQGLNITGVPGLAIAVRFRGSVLYACCGTRDLALGDRAPVDNNTIFPIASLSKPVTSTIMAYLLAKHGLGWLAPINDFDPSYRVDPKVTVAALLAHRSGLIDHAGDLLEDLGFPRNEILQRITTLQTWPVISESPYACAYQYTNFGYSEAAFALGMHLNAEWEDLAQRFFYDYGMMRSTYRDEEFLQRDNIVKPYQRNPFPRADRPPLPSNPSWFEPAQRRNPDAQSPAGGVTSSVSDLALWMRLSIQAERAANPDTFFANIRQTHVAYPEWNDPAHYGYGWNTRTDPHMGFNLSHSGGFELGASTCVGLLPEEDLGIVALTNGQPIGLPEAICRQFLYDVTSHPDLQPFAETLATSAAFMQRGVYPVPDPDFTRPPTKPATPITDPSRFTGTYFNGYYQNAVITGSGSANDPFVMQAGIGERFVLTPYEELTFTFETTGENADGPSGVTFAPDGSALSVNHFTIPERDHEGGLVLKPGVFEKV